MNEADQPERLETLFTEIQAAPAVSDAIWIFQRDYDLDFVTYHLALTIAAAAAARCVLSTKSTANCECCSA